MNSAIKILPLASIGLVALSFLNMHLYFRNFGIQIQQYIEVSEIIFSLTTFIPGTIMFVFVTLFWLLFRRQKSDGVIKDESPNKLRRYFRTHRIKKLRSLAHYTDESFIIAVIAFVVIIVMLAFGPAISSDSDLLQSSQMFDFYSLLIVIFLTAAISMIASHINRFDLDSTKGYAIVAGLLFILTLFFLAYRNNKSSEFVLNGRPKYEVKLLTSHQLYLTDDDSLVYVGATHNYYFLHHTKDSTSLVIPSADVYEASFKKLRTGL